MEKTVIEKHRDRVNEALARLTGEAADEDNYWIADLLTVICEQGRQINALKARVRKANDALEATNAVVKTLFDTVTRVERQQKK